MDNRGPPPPPPGARVGGNVGPPPPPPNMRPPPPPPGHHQGPPQGPQPQRGPPPAINSMRVSDLRPKPVLDDAYFKKQLTEYLVFSARKALPTNPKEDATWARATVVQEKFEQGEIAKQIKRLSEHNRKSVAEQKAALAPYQNGQVTKILDELMTNDRDPNFTYSLAQIDLKQQPTRWSSKAGKDPKKKSSSKSCTKIETVQMTIYIQRTPQPHINPRHLYDMIHKGPPPPQQQGGQQQGGQQQGGPPPPPPPPGPTGQNGGRGGPNGNDAPYIKLPPREASRGPADRVRRAPSYHSDSGSSSDSYDSDSDSMSRGSSSVTSQSTLSKRGGRDHRRNQSRRPSHPRNVSHSHARGRSQSRPRKDAPRQHQKDYYLPRSPEPWNVGHNMAHPQPIRPAPVPHIPTTPAMDPVEAYRRGQMDAKAELDRHSSPHVPLRPLIVQDPPPMRQIAYRPRRESFAEQPRYPGPEPNLPGQYALDLRYETPVSPRLRQEPRYGEERYFEQNRAFVPDARDFGYQERPYPARRGSRVEQFAPDFPEFRSDGYSSRSSSPHFRDMDLPYRRREREIEDYVDRHRGEPRISPIRGVSSNPFISMSPPRRRHYSPVSSSFSGSRGR